MVELSRESLNRQAEQNAQMARQSQAVTETTHELIKAESTVQSDANQLQQELHTERSTLDQQRQDLENERRSLAAERQRDPIIAETIKGLAIVVAAALPLVVCWYLVRSLFLSTSEDFTAAEILIEQLATQGPLLTAVRLDRPAPRRHRGPSNCLSESAIASLGLSLKRWPTATARASASSWSWKAPTMSNS